jgi:hypothetical protein
MCVILLDAMASYNIEQNDTLQNKKIKTLF